MNYIEIKGALYNLDQILDIRKASDNRILFSLPFSVMDEYGVDTVNFDTEAERDQAFSEIRAQALHQDKAIRVRIIGSYAGGPR